MKIGNYRSSNTPSACGGVVYLVEVRKLLRQSGDQIERSDEFIKRLIEQTNGEPLFLRFLCQDIAGWGEQAETHLKEIPGEVKDYFQRQFKLLRERTKEAHDRNLPLDILKTLMVAHGGMTAEELAGVLGVPTFDIRENLELIERFLLGKERKELMHLEFRRTVEEALVREEEKEAVLEKLLTYCAKYWQKDQTKERYALRYYLQHLWELKRYQEMFDLSDAGYLEVKLGRLFSPELLEEDYNALFEACKELDDLKGLLRWGIHRAGISDEVAAFRDIENIPEIFGKLAQQGMKNWWERGVGICALIPGIAGKVEGFLGLCMGLEPGKGEPPDNVFERVRELFRKIPLGQSKDGLIARYVKELCSWGVTHIEQALDAAAQIGDEEYRSSALASVAQGYGQLPDVEIAAAGLSQVLDAAARIGFELYRSSALASVAQGYGQLPDVEIAAAGLSQVLDAAARIGFELYRSSALASVAQGYGQLPDVEIAAAGLSQVLDAAARIGFELYRSSALASVAQGYGQLPDVEKAVAGLSQVLDAAAQIEVERYRFKALASVAQGYGQLPDVEKAVAGLSQVLDAAAQIEVERYRFKALASVAQGYGQLPDVEKAAAGLSQVLDAAAQIEVEPYRSSALASVAQGYGQLPDVEKAVAGLSQVLDAAAQIGDEEYRSRALASVAQGYGQLSDVEKTAKVLKQALDAAAQIGDEWSRSEALASVAQGYGQLSDVEKAAKVLKQALDAAAQIGDEEYRFKVKALASVAQGYGQLPDVEIAAAGLSQVLDAAAQIGDEEYRSSALASVAQGYGQLPDVEIAAAGLSQVLDAAAQIGDEEYRSRALASVAQGYGQLSDVEKTAKVINYPAASGRGIRRAIIADLHAVSDIPFLDFSHNCRSYPHSHASRQCLRSNRPSRIRLPIISSSPEDSA